MLIILGRFKGAITEFLHQAESEKEFMSYLFIHDCTNNCSNYEL